MRIHSNITCFAVLIICLLAGSACTPRSHDTVAEYTLEAEGYRNHFFDFSLTLPRDWHITVSKGTEAYFLDIDEASGGDRRLRREMEEADAWSHPLLGISPEPPGLPGDLPQFLVVAEDMRFRRSDRSPEGALLLIRDTINQITPNARFPEKPRSGELGGRSFTVMRVEYPVEDTVIKSFIYVTFERGYALCFITFFLDSEQFRDIQRVLHSIRFQAAADTD